MVKTVSIFTHTRAVMNLNRLARSPFQIQFREQLTYEGTIFQGEGRVSGKPVTGAKSDGAVSTQS